MANLNGNFRGIRSSASAHQVGNWFNNSLICANQTRPGGISTLVDPTPWNNPSQIIPFYIDYTSENPSRLLIIPSGASLFGGPISGSVIAGEEGAQLSIGLVQSLEDPVEDLVILLSLNLFPGENMLSTILSSFNPSGGIVVLVVSSGSVSSVVAEMDVKIGISPYFQFNCR